ncbi:hypothetical protein HGRIS_007760 [Hohenbuehelia grisea]|uniref:SAP domain-containing protein n=1 Tax=Hohenbuehelia grisea TaxID=104357 RepID=A0ABR3J5U4_9AGAR
MARLPSRKALESMKRTDLQKLCKDYGVKANLKSEALIDLLLGANEPQAKAGPSTRSVSTRQPSRSIPRTSSVIIHDIDNEDSETDVPEPQQQEIQPPTTRRVSRSNPAPAAPPPRTKKAKETQLRLGVGRPVAAGGSGARAVTKSTSLSRVKRAKSSKSMQPTEAPIPEEEPEETKEPSMFSTRQTGLAEITNGLAAPEHEPSPKLPPTVNQVAGPSAVQAPPVSVDISVYVAAALQPLREEIQTLRAELSLLKAQSAPLEVLQNKVETMTSEMDSLRSQAAEALATSRELQEILKTASNPITPPNKSPPRDVPPAPLSMNVTTIQALADANARSPSPAGSRTLHGFSADSLPPTHPGFAPSMLGKRHRDSVGSNVTGVFEEGQEDDFDQDELAKRVLRPMKKKAKLSREDPGPSEAGPSSSPATGLSANDEAQENQVPPLLAAPHIPSFTVYQDPDSESDYVDPPPPNIPLPDFFEPPSPSESGPARLRHGTSSTANASENQHPFSFSFLPFTASTPARAPGTAQSLFLPTLAYPEVPQSPTPGPPRATNAGPFTSFGLPLPGRPASGAGRPQPDAGLSAFVNPAALGGSSRPGSTEPSTQAQGSRGATAEPPAKRTMYGTELEGDTRFGDFGVEGVASGPMTGFWAGGRM